MRSWGIVLGLLVLTACGGGDASVSSGADIAEAANCSNYKGGADQQFISDGGTCTIDGQDVFVYYFSDNDNRDQWVNVASELAGGDYLVGDHFVVQANTPQLEKAQEGLGGEIKS
jgi:hypothetical protein